jgi:hypothetical protein
MAVGTGVTTMRPARDAEVMTVTYERWRHLSSLLGIARAKDAPARFYRPLPRDGRGLPPDL